MGFWADKFNIILSFDFQVVCRNGACIGHGWVEVTKSNEMGCDNSWSEEQERDEMRPNGSPERFDGKGNLI